MRIISFSIIIVALASFLRAGSAHAQAPPGKFVSITVETDSVRIAYELFGPVAEEYIVTLYLQRENEPNALRKLDNVSGDAGEGKFAGVRRTIVWDKREVANPVAGARYQFALEFRKAGGSGLPWYLYAGGAVVGVAVYLAVKPPPPPPPDIIVVPTIPIPPPR
jgi:hypothetical protein